MSKKKSGNRKTAITPDSSKLIERVQRVCQRLAPHGWRELLAHHDLNIMSDNLAAELGKPLTRIDRTLDGFQDFASEGTRGIEPGKPSFSLLFHALASPQVTTGIDGKPLRTFPTPAEIEAVENYVYGVNPPSIQDLRVSANDAPLAIVVFASEYRPAINTVHQKHADMCFARTGIARIGTHPAKYLPEARGYLPFMEADGRAIRILPCRYSAYIAAQYLGDKEDFGPMRFRETGDRLRDFSGIIRNIKVLGDETRQFWVPLHKLFDGEECIRGKVISLKLVAHHVNQKLRRIHQALSAQGQNTGWHEPDISEPPFIFTEGLAEFSSEADDAQGLLVPQTHKRLVEPAMFKGKAVTYFVPTDNKPFSSSLNINAKKSGARAAPEYVHARHQIKDDGTERNLNDEPDVKAIVQKGGYQAKHFIDYTAEGWVAAECEGLSLEVPRTLAAYSLIAPPDFFPAVKQQDLMQWWNQSAPPDVVNTIWPTNPGPPETLCDIRYAANYNLEDSRGASDDLSKVFDISDDTMTAIVSFKHSGRDKGMRIDSPKNLRAPSLPDGAAGVFAPGWDCSIDRTDEVDPSDDGTLVLPGKSHLAGYGLGSPFPEDAKLCAALSSFWPAAAPDVTRTFEPGRYATATPLTDDVLGQTPGSVPWDGIRGPRIPDPAIKEVEYAALDYGDYVERAMNNDFNISLIGQISATDYAARTLVMARVYQVLGAITREEKTQWALFSFTHADDYKDERREAEKATGKKMDSSFSYRFQIFQHKGVRANPSDFRTKLVKFEEMLTLFADPQKVLKRISDGSWRAYEF